MTNTVESLLRKYGTAMSADGLAAFVAHSVDSGRTDDSRYAPIAVKYFERLGKFEKSAKICSRFRLARALSIDECVSASGTRIKELDCDDYLVAVIKASKTGPKLIAGCRRAMRYAERLGDFNSAAEAAERMDDCKRAKMYDDLHEFIKYGVDNAAVR